MRSGTSRRTSLAAAAAVAGSLALTACSAGSLGSDDGDSGTTEITFLTNNDPNNVTTAEAVIEAFEAANPDVSVKLDTRPGGAEGDNLVKTRLSTDDMAQVFEYNSGSLFQAIGPQENLQPVTDEAWVADLDETFTEVVTAGGEVYGAPWGPITGGGILYNIPLYDELGLEVPATWDEFMANNDEIKDAGVAPVEQSYADTWTSQIMVLANHHNVQAANPGFAEDYTSNEAKFATTPEALAGFQRLQELNEAGYLNEDYASDLFTDGLTAVATGEAAHYPMITFGVSGIAGVAPDNVNDVGFFALPGDDASTNGPTLWYPSGIYIPKTVEGEELEAAKKFQAFLASPGGCEAQAGAAPVGGPFAVTTCELPADVPVAVEHLSAYVDEGPSTPALEFLSPIKGPALEQITVEVGSGIRSAQGGAELYDKDVEKQAQQLGLEGW
jgi:raffinose/stachyose/melibiose transport system substrate-binding protein